MRLRRTRRSPVHSLSAVRPDEAWTRLAATETISRRQSAIDQARPPAQSAPRPASTARAGSIGSQKRSRRCVSSHQVAKR